MPRVDIPIGGGLYQDESLPVSAQDCLNLVPNYPATITGEKQQYLANTPGTKIFTDVGGSPLNMIRFQETLYVITYDVSTAYLKEVDSAGTVTTIGALAGASDNVKVLAENGQTIAIVEVGTTNGWFYDTVSGLVKIVDATYTSAATGSVAQVDGYFVFTRWESNEFFITSNVVVNKGQDFDALDFGSEETDSDFNVKAFSLRGELFIAGNRTIGAYRNVGGSGFPFQRVEGGHFNIGIVGSSQIIVEADNFYCLAGPGERQLAVYKGSNSSLEKISSRAIDVILNLDTLPNFIPGRPSIWSHLWQGHRWVGLYVGRTSNYIYDEEASLLSQKPTWFRTENLLNGYNTAQAVDEHKKLIYLPTGPSNCLYELSLTLYSEDSNLVERTFVSRYVNNLGKRVVNNRVELSVESGVGASASDDPQVTLSISDDGGKNFTSVGSRGLGVSGDTTKKLVWHRLGIIEDSRCYKFTITDDVKVVFKGLTADLTPVQ